MKGRAGSRRNFPVVVGNGDIFDEHDYADRVTRRSRG